MKTAVIGQHADMAVVQRASNREPHREPDPLQKVLLFISVIPERVREMQRPTVPEYLHIKGKWHHLVAAALCPGAFFLHIVRHRESADIFPDLSGMRAGDFHDHAQRAFFNNLSTVNAPCPLFCLAAGRNAGFFFKIRAARPVLEQQNEPCLAGRQAPFCVQIRKNHLSRPVHTHSRAAGHYVKCLRSLRHFAAALITSAATFPVYSAQPHFTPHTSGIRRVGSPLYRAVRPVCRDAGLNGNLPAFP